MNEMQLALSKRDGLNPAVTLLTRKLIIFFFVTSSAARKISNNLTEGESMVLLKKLKTMSFIYQTQQHIMINM